MWLDRLQRLDDHILDSVHYCCEIDTVSLKVLLKLGQIPLASILFIVVSDILASICTGILNVVLILLIDRVVCQMDEAGVRGLLTIGILLRRKPD